MNRLVLGDFSTVVATFNTSFQLSDKGYNVGKGIKDIKREVMKNNMGDADSIPITIMSSGGFRKINVENGTILGNEKLKPNDTISVDIGTPAKKK